MHDTVVMLRDGTVRVGFLWRARPAEGYILLGGVSGQQDPLRILLNDIATATTLGERISRGVVGDHDELAHWRKYMRDGREYGWDGLTPGTPMQEWEKDDQGNQPHPHQGV